MSAMSRRKGATHEREVVNILKASGHPCARNLDQTRDGGGDIPFGDWLIECKRRHKIAIYEWWDQCVAACEENRKEWQMGFGVIKDPAKKPMLVIRADHRDNLVVIGLNDFLDLLSRTPPSTQGSARVASERAEG